MKENEHVRTAIRWRLSADGAILEKVNDKILSFGSQHKLYTFDHVINIPDQKKVYEILVEPMVKKSLEGYDCTFLASGQTGSGKTYTMGFESNASMNSDNSGMTRRALNSIFSCGKAVQVFISFVEVYNDQVFDLLVQNPQEALYKRDQRACEPTKKLVQNECEVNATLVQGTKNRRVRGTKMNSASSRSHAVFTIYLGIESSQNTKRESLINFVDLAGSEGVRKTGTIGEAHAEGKSINESLSAFKRVFVAMSSGAKHIPFRDSLITYILRGSLKEDCYVTLLGCVSPFQRDYGETLSTLNFVADAKQIKITPRLNAIIDEFQKSNTPVKTSHQTPNSSFRSMKQQSPLVTRQTRASLSSRLTSDQTSQSTLGNSISKRRLTTTTRQSVLNPKAKRATLSSSRNARTSTVGVKSTNVASSAATRQTGMGSGGSVNWNKASMAKDANYHRFDSSHAVRSIRKSTFPPDKDDVLNIVKSLEDVIKDEMTDGREINRAAIAEMLDQLKVRLNVQNPSIDVSFCPASTATLIQSPMLSTVVEDTEAVSDRDMDTNEPNPNMISSSCLEAELNDLVEQSALISSANNPVKALDPAVKVAMNYDHLENRILFNVDEQFIDTSTVHSETPETMQRNASQCETVRKCDSFPGTALGGKLAINARHESMRQNSEEAIEDMVSSTTIIDSPKITKRIPVDNVRTPIGKLIIRKVAPACDFESTRYAVEMINRTRPPLQVQSPVDYTHFCETPTRTSHKFPMSTAVKRNPNRSIHHRLPLSPRIIVDRIGSPQQRCISQPSKRQAVAETRSTVQRGKVTRTVGTGAGEKLKSKPKKTDDRLRILKILNTGNERDLQKLSKIGIKTAAQILSYRNVKGPLKSIEELKKIGWSRNMCQKFVAANIFE
ncbi:kinesin-related protein 5-like [Bradysia coprophila]|uniref:kinesin-related protein 5-like n=1 Tax=Bradysia coprophila TaxID=38358 RepID=UPI00187D9487|nr:kinesin-related protein 5-like [Bradysia coprophila]